MRMSKKDKIEEDGTVAGCYRLKKPIPPNVCAECPKHSDLTCQDVKSGGNDKRGKR
jgi:hypothetical protein